MRAVVIPYFQNSLESSELCHISPQVNIPSLKDNVQLWMKDHHVKGFYSALQSPTMSDGARSMMSLSGLGKVSE